jgi:hypothetical protein
VALPFSPHTREQLEWLAEDVHEAQGEASVWLAEPATAAEQESLERALTAAVTAEYRTVITEARTAHAEAAAARRRTLARLRREMRRIRARDYFPPPVRAEAETALDELAALVGVGR